MWNSINRNIKKHYLLFELKTWNKRPKIEWWNQQGKNSDKRRRKNIISSNKLALIGIE